MGSYAALDHTSWLGGYDFTGYSNDLRLELPVEFGDDTRFGQVARSREATFEGVTATVLGFWEADTTGPDPEIFARLGGTLQVATHSVDGAEGSVAYTYQTKTFAYQVGAKVGELLPFTMSAQGVRGNGSLSVGAVRAQVTKAKGSVSSTGATGTAQQLGAIGAGQHLYAALHVFSAGTTLTAVVESDDNANFTSATTRATFSSVTTAGGFWATRLAGPVTDDWYRLRITAITGTFTVAAVVGIK